MLGQLLIGCPWRVAFPGIDLFWTFSIMGNRNKGLVSQTASLGPVMESAWLYPLYMTLSMVVVTGAAAITHDVQTRTHGIRTGSRDPSVREPTRTLASTTKNQISAGPNQAQDKRTSRVPSSDGQEENVLPSSLVQLPCSVCLISTSL